jgi:hypothetical protein
MKNEAGIMSKGQEEKVFFHGFVFFLAFLDNPLYFIYYVITNGGDRYDE